MSNENIKKCSKCNITYDQNLGNVIPNEVEKQKRIFNKNGKHFCFGCLASEYNVNCQYCHQRINSKDELGSWSGGALSINGDYDYCKADDRVFNCLGCDKKISELWKKGVKPSWHSGWGPILFPEHNIRKCRIVGCSQKPYYECMDLCLPHSRPCKGGKIKSDGKICSATVGSDEGDICEFCKNQTETYQQQKDSLENESNQGSRESIQDNNGNDEKLLPSNPVAPTSQINNSNNQSDDSVNPGNSPQPNPGKDNSSETKNNVKTIKFGSKENDSQNNPVKTDDETLIINLKNVKKITYIVAKDSLVIEFNSKQEGQVSQTITSSQINNNQELRTVKNYLQKNNQTSLGQQELDKIFSKQNNNSVANEKPKGDNKALLIGGSVVILVIGIGIGLFLKRKKVSKKSVKTLSISG